MSKLVLKEFRCVEDTDESGAESPYFVVFVGDLETGSTALKLIRQGNWHDEVHKGELWTANATVVSSFSLKPDKTLVSVALIEEDNDLDISNSFLNIIKEMATIQFKSFKDSGATKVTSAIAGSINNTLRTWLNVSLDNDDLMGVKRLKLNGQTGLQSLLNYFADTGHYRVRFVVE